GLLGLGLWNLPGPASQHPYPRRRRQDHTRSHPQRVRSAHRPHPGRLVGAKPTGRRLHRASPSTGPLPRIPPYLGGRHPSGVMPARRRLRLPRHRVDRVPLLRSHPLTLHLSASELDEELPERFNHGTHENSEPCSVLMIRGERPVVGIGVSSGPNNRLRHSSPNLRYPKSFFSRAQVSNPPLAKGNRIPDSRRVSASVEGNQPVSPL